MYGIYGIYANIWGILMTHDDRNWQSHKPHMPCYIYIWQVSHREDMSGWWFQPLWKIVVSWIQLGLLFPVYGKIIQMFQTTNQYLEIRGTLWLFNIAMV